MTVNKHTKEEAIRNPHHSIHYADGRPSKPLKHRYERRKVREFMKQGEWDEDSPGSGQA